MKKYILTTLIALLLAASAWGADSIKVSLVDSTTIQDALAKQNDPSANFGGYYATAVAGNAGTSGRNIYVWADLSATPAGAYITYGEYKFYVHNAYSANEDSLYLIYSPLTVTWCEGNRGGGNVDSMVCWYYRGFDNVGTRSVDGSTWPIASYDWADGGAKGTAFDTVNAGGATTGDSVIAVVTEGLQGLFAGDNYGFVIFGMATTGSDVWCDSVVYYRTSEDATAGTGVRPVLDYWFIPLPSTPTALAVDTSNCAVAVLSWSDSTDADSIFVLRDGEPIDTIAIGVETYTDSSASGSYTWSLIAKNIAGISDTTAEATGTIAGCYTVYWNTDGILPSTAIERYTAIRDSVDALLAANPTWTLDTLGLATNDSVIYAVVIATEGWNKTAMFDGAIHGNEEETAYGCLGLLNWLSANPDTFPRIRKVVIPVANPEGMNANRRYVMRITGLDTIYTDLNRNFPVGWNVDNGWGLTNPGPSAASEAETQAMMSAGTEYSPDIYRNGHTNNSWLSVADSSYWWETTDVYDSLDANGFDTTSSATKVIPGGGFAMAYFDSIGAKGYVHEYGTNANAEEINRGICVDIKLLEKLQFIPVIDTVTALACSLVTITWTEEDSTTSLCILLDADSLDTVEDSVFSYTDTVDGVGTYTYSLIAYSATDTSDTSGTYAITLAVPDSVTGLAASIVSIVEGELSIRLDWTAVAGADSYYVYVNEVFDSATVETFMTYTPGDDSTYAFTVSAVNECGEGTASATVSRSTAQATAQRGAFRNQFRNSFRNPFRGR